MEKQEYEPIAVELGVEFVQLEDIPGDGLYIRFGLRHPLTLVLHGTNRRVQLPAGYVLKFTVDNLGYGASVNADRFYNEGLVDAAEKLMDSVAASQILEETLGVPF